MGGPEDTARARHPPRLRRPGIDRFELALLVLLAALSLWIVAMALWEVLVNHRIWTGSETIYFEDGFQSMMWIQGILHHGASPDLYVLGSTPADYFEPLVAISAGITWLGVAPYLALLFWKPLAVGAVFFAARAYIHRLVPDAWPRRAALLLALFFAWGVVIGDAWIPNWSWGYPFALIALACALGSLILYNRDRSSGRSGLLPALLGLMTSWLHPWQGEILILLLLSCELWIFLRREPVRLGPLLLTVALTALPLAYFAALVKFDLVWSREREIAVRDYSLWHVFAALWPLMIPALLAYRFRPRTFLELTLRVWPFAALSIFLFSEWKGSGPTHALLGVTIPLAVLAVQGVCRLPWKAVLTRAPAYPLLAIPLLLALTVPGTVAMMGIAEERVEPRPGRSTYISSGESSAFAFLAHDPAPGGVMARFFEGMLVPPLTGRQTYVGNCYWSEPHCRERNHLAERLIRGHMSATRAQAFVESSGARFVLADCRSDPKALALELAPITTAIERFSCATVYVIRSKS